MSKKRSKENPMAPVEPKDPKDGSDQDWEAESAMNDILRADKHRGDPKMMDRIGKIAGRKMKALSGLKGVARIRASLNEKYGPGSQD